MASSDVPCPTETARSPNFGLLSPPVDANDASSDDGESLRTPLSGHDGQNAPYALLQQEQHRFSPGLFTFAPKDRPGSVLGTATPHDLDFSATLSPLSPFPPSSSEPAGDRDQPSFFSFSTNPRALDLANASLSIGFSPDSNLDDSLDHIAPPFALNKSPSSDPGDLSEFLPPLPSFSIDSLSSDSSSGEIATLLFSSSDNYAAEARPPLSRSSKSDSTLVLKARMYSPRFPLDHVLNPFFARTYCLGDELGAGGYGFVMTARHRTEGHEVAVKFIIKDKVPDHAWCESDSLGRIPTEVMLLSLISHPNIVRCIDMYEDEIYCYMVQELHGSPWISKKKKKNKQVTAPGKLVAPSPLTTPLLTPSASFDSVADASLQTPPLISVDHVSSDVKSDTDTPSVEHHHNLGSMQINALASSSSIRSVRVTGEPGQNTHLQPTPPSHIRPSFSRRPSYDLFECIEQSKHKRLSESDARYVFAQVVEAVHYLDSQGITHCDIKDENLLVDSNLKVKLIDFGSAVVADPSLPRPYYTLFFGTTAYASSEILRKQAYQAPPAEIWTLGVLLSYLLTGHSPFPAEQDAIDGRIVLREPSSGRLSRAAVALMGRCLERDPERRADITEVRGHRWLQGALQRDDKE